MKKIKNFDQFINEQKQYLEKGAIKGVTRAIEFMYMWLPSNQKIVDEYDEIDDMDLPKEEKIKRITTFFEDFADGEEFEKYSDGASYEEVAKDVMNVKYNDED